MARDEAIARGVGIVTLGDRDQTDLVSRARGLGGSPRHRRFDLGQVSCDVGNA
jgi:hypothetical protein